MRLNRLTHRLMRLTRELTGVDKWVDGVQIFQSLPHIMFDTKIVSYVLQLVFRTTEAIVKVSHSGRRLYRWSLAGRRGWQRWTSELTELTS